MSSATNLSRVRRSTGLNFNNCVQFNQATSNITYTSPSALDINSDFSYFQYFKIDTIDATSRRIIDQSNQGLLVLFNTSNLQVQVRYSSTNGSITMPLVNLTKNVWHDLVVIWSNSFNYPTVYFDGQLIVAGAVTKVGTRLPAAGLTTYLGNRSGSDRAMSGYLDKHSFIARQATIAEVQAFHQNGTLPSSALVSYEMDEVSGNLIDSSGNNVTGTPGSVAQGVPSLVIPNRNVTPALFTTNINSVVDTSEDYKSLGFGCNQQKIDINSNGRIFVGYRKKLPASSGIYEPYVAYSDNASSWTPVNIANITTDNQRNPTILVDRSNAVHVVWYGKDPNNTGTNQRQIKYAKSTDNGLTYSAWMSVGGDVNGYTNSTLWQEHPVIVQDINNNSIFYVAWEGRDANNPNAQQVKFSKSTDSGNTWSAWANANAAQPSNSCSRPAIAQTANGNLNILFYSSFGATGGVQQIQHIVSTDGGNTWSANTIIGNTGFDARNASCVADGNNIHCVFRSTNSTYSTTQIYYSFYNGSSWSAPVAISPHLNFYQFFPTITVVNSTPTVLWTETSSSSSYPSDDPTTGDVYIVQRLNGTWQSLQNLTNNGTSLYPYKTSKTSPYNMICTSGSSSFSITYYNITPVSARGATSNRSIIP